MKKNTLYSLIISLFLYTNLAPFSVTYAKPEQTHSTSTTIDIKLLGINDFHGQISAGRIFRNQPVGGAAVLAAYLKKAQSGMEDRTIITIMGDQVGASAPSSGLLHDEPSILFTNSLGNNYCSTDTPANPLCNIVATIGNHEFDKGQKKMFDLIYGTKKPPTRNWIPLDTYPGAAYPYISANIVDVKTKKPLFPPYTIKYVHNIPVAFIGAILKNAPSTMFPKNAEGVKFLDEAKSINKYIPEIKEKGAQIIVVLIHEGGNQPAYEGKTRTNTQVQGKINTIVTKLDDSVDVVMAGHTHSFLNAYIPNHNGVNILVTQANSYSASFAEVNLQVDTQTHKITHKSAQIITTYAKRWPGTKPDKRTQELVQLAENNVEPIVNKQVGTLENKLLRRQNDDGESNIGNFIADAFKTAMDADIGMTNQHGIRADIYPGTITWGTIFSALPFSNHVVTITLTGQDIYELLEQQWLGPNPNVLQISGIRYTYDYQKPRGSKIISIQHEGKPLIKDKTYTIATTDFLASGGGIFTVMKRAKIIKNGGKDHDRVIQYMAQLPVPFSVSIDGRIKKV